ncbi:MAG TPA: type II secretion system F family protein [Candidatus Saccharimonadales bacterium]|nr:type II secretion system F family protein [Candidatus Saccharimonadales bacterium]
MNDTQPPVPSPAASSSKPTRAPKKRTELGGKSPVEILKSFGRPHIPFKEREYFTENLSLLLKSAVPIGDILESLEGTVRSKAMRQALAQVRLDIEAGYSLADALERSRVVSGQTLALVRLGENSGHLVKNLQLAANQEEKRHNFRAKVRSALIYPVFVLSVTLIVGLGVAWFLLPRLSATFTQLRVKLPPISRIMIGFGVFLKAHGLIVIPLAAAAIGVLLYIFFVHPKTKWMGQRFLLKTPGVGRLLHEVEVAQFGYLLGTLLEAGLPITKSLNLLADASTTYDYKLLYLSLAESLDNGFSFKESLKRYPKSMSLIPLAVQQMVVAGEHSGSLSEVLLIVGRTYEDKSDVTTENLETIMEPILLLIVAGGVLLVAVSVLLPIYSLLGGLNKP